MSKISNIKIARITSGLTQNELSKVTNIPRWKISLCEQGCIVLNKNEALKLSKTLLINLKLIPIIS